jgi:hypothetical protein
LARANVKDFAAKAQRDAGGRRIWYVSAPGYITHPGTCEALSNAFAGDRDRRQLTVSDEQIFEKPALQLFTVR